MITSVPAFAKRRARPKPSAPDAPITQTGSVLESDKAPEYRLTATMGFEAGNKLSPAAASMSWAARARGLGADGVGARVAIAQGNEHGVHAW
jgi:hypothetical protein